MWLDDDLYRQVLESVPIACVDCVIIRDGKALLLKRADPPAQNEWWVPGGRVWKGERMRQTAYRKALTEAGLDCHVGPIVHTAETIFDDGPGGVSVHSVNVCFLLWPKHDDPAVLDSNHLEFRWVDLIEPGLHDYVKRCLEGAGLK